MPRFEISFPDLPPSMNESRGGGYQGNRHAQHRVKKDLEGQLFVALMQGHVPRGLSRVTASAVLTFPTRRTRDPGNFRYMLEKALGDILKKQRYLEDDDESRFKFDDVTTAYEKGVRLTTVTLEVEADGGEW